MEYIMIVVVILTGMFRGDLEGLGNGVKKQLRKVIECVRKIPQTLKKIWLDIIQRRPGMDREFPDYDLTEEKIDTWHKSGFPVRRFRRKHYQDVIDKFGGDLLMVAGQIKEINRKKNVRIRRGAVMVAELPAKQSRRKNLSRFDSGSRRHMYRRYTYRR